MDPSTPETLYVSIAETQANPDKPIKLKPGIYRTRNGGRTWTDVTGGLKDVMTRYLCLGINPADPEVLYVGCTGGFWRKRIK